MEARQLGGGMGSEPYLENKEIFGGKPNRLVERNLVKNAFHSGTKR